MRLRGRRVGELTVGDLQSLVAARSPESVELEYKLELPGTSDSEKREYLADVAAFANTSGGVLLYGVETERDEDGGRDTGIPKELRGVTFPNENELRLRLNNIVRDGLDPRLVPDISIQVIDIAEAARVVAVGIARSVVGPHAISFQKYGKFYRRSAAAKYQADTREIRRMFLEGDSWEAMARDFRDQRLGEFLSGSFEISLRVDARLFVHLLPLGRRDTAVDVRPQVVGIQQWADDLLELGSQRQPSFNYEGYLIAGLAPDSTVSAYAQFFRSGGIEGCTHRFHDSRPGVGGLVRVFDLADFANWLPRAARTSVELLARDLGVDPPLGLYVTAMDMRDRLTTAVGRRSGVFSRETIRLPMIYLPDLGVDWETVCDPALLVLSQSANLRDILR